MDFERIGIVGLGLIGGSLALAVRRAWPGATIVGVDIDEGVVREARERNLVSDASTDLASLADADLVVLAAPVRANIAALPAVAPGTREGCLLTDVGSTKRGILAAARSAGCHRRFVGGHPLAGAASSGLADVSADLLTGRPWILTPENDAPPALVARLERFLAAIGAVPRTMKADEHDRLMAVVSHLPQLVASTLMQVAGEMAGEEGLALAGSGLADTTRLASSPSGIWRDICRSNADHLAPALQQLIDALERLRDDLPHGDHLERVFAAARGWRDRLTPRR